MIRWGIIGPGKIAHKFAQDLATVEGAKLVAVASTNKERAEVFSQKYRAEFAFDSYEKLVKCADVDVVYIGSVHTGHYEQTMLCLRNKKAVLCEKPFAMKKTEVEEMIATAQANGVFLMEALWSRFMPWTLKMLELLPKLGKISLLKADFGFQAEFDPKSRLFDKSIGGGTWLDIGIYPAFLSYLVFGNPTKITAQAIFAETGADQSVAVILSYENNEMAVLDATTTANTNCIAQIFGQNGTIEVHPRWHESQGLTVKWNNGHTETFDFSRQTFGYDYEIREVNNCLENSELQSKLWSWKDSANLITLLDNVRAEVGLEYA